MLYGQLIFTFLQKMPLG